MNGKTIEQEIQAKGLTAPRVTSDAIEAEITAQFFFTGGEGIAGAMSEHSKTGNADESRCGVDCAASLDLITFCVLRLRNGFTVAGESACASPENFDAEIGRTIARRNAVAKVWPLLGFRLRDSLTDKAEKKGG